MVRPAPWLLGFAVCALSLHAQALAQTENPYDAPAAEPPVAETPAVEPAPVPSEPAPPPPSADALVAPPVPGGA
ncbi:MAG: hypothetical protein M3020_07010, partial [Myxococcota bacterium]|nr:hypothetical protein [Myxococcota bacterium]